MFLGSDPKNIEANTTNKKVSKKIGKYKNISISQYFIPVTAQ